MSEDPLALNRTVTIGAAWAHAAFLLGKLIVFGNTIVLARLLVPEDFGLVAIGLVVLAYMDTVSEAGVSAAVVWHKDDPEKLAAVAMTVAVLSALVVCVLTYLVAPTIADFFHEPEAKQIIRVLAVSFIFTSPALVFSSLLQRRFEFRRRIIPELAKSFSKGIVGIGLALAGFGAWSLVYGHIAGVMVALGLFLAISRWRASLSFDRSILRDVLPFGLQMMLVGLLGIAIKNLDYFVVGRYFDARLLGIYFLAFTVIDQIVMGICWAASQSLFPAFSSIKNDVANLRQLYGHSLSGVAALTLPTAAGIAVVAEPMIYVLYGENWSEAIPVIQVLAVYAAIYSLGFNLGDIYKATGKPHILTYISLVNLAVAVPVLVVSSRWGLLGVALGQVAVAFFITLLNWVVAARVLAIGLATNWNAFRAPLLATVAMVGACLVVDRATALEPSSGKLVILMVVGAVVYVIALFLLAPSIMRSTLKLINPADLLRIARKP